MMSKIVDVIKNITRHRISEANKDLTLKLIRQIESRLFPEFKGDEVVNLSGSKYSYFSPSWYFKKEALPGYMVKNLLKNRNMKFLSVGSGEAYLERFLVAIGIKHEQIHLSDIGIFPKRGFTYFQFDMHGDWPKTMPKYDYIFFAESFCSLPDPIAGTINTLIRFKPAINAMADVLIKALAQLKRGGEIIIAGPLLNSCCLREVVRIIVSRGYNLKILHITEAHFPINPAPTFFLKKL